MFDVVFTHNFRKARRNSASAEFCCSKVIASIKSTSVETLSPTLEFDAREAERNALVMDSSLDSLVSWTRISKSRITSPNTKVSSRQKIRSLICKHREIERRNILESFLCV